MAFMSSAYLMGMENFPRFTIQHPPLRPVPQQPAKPIEHLVIEHEGLKPTNQNDRPSNYHLPALSVNLNPLEQHAQVNQSPAIPHLSPAPSFLGQMINRMYSGVQKFISPQSIRIVSPASPLNETLYQSQSGMASLPTFTSPATPVSSIHNPTPQTVIVVAQTPQRPITMANLGTPATPQSIDTATPSPSFALHTRPALERNIQADDSNYLPHNRRGGLHRVPAYYQEPAVSQIPALTQDISFADISFEVDNNGGLYRQQHTTYARPDENLNNGTTWADLTKYATNHINNEVTSPVGNVITNHAAEPMSPAHPIVSHAALEEKSPARQQAPIRQIITTIVRQAYTTLVAGTQSRQYVTGLGIDGKTVKKYAVLNPSKK